MSNLRMESINGGPVIEYRALDGHPVPYKVTVQRRELTPDGDEYRDGASQWCTITLREVIAQVELNGPVAEWLRTQTRVDTSPRALMASGDLDDSAYVWNVNARKG